MIISKLMGGLGNQMFQAVAGFALSKLHKTKLKLDLSFLRENNVSTESFTAREYELGIFNTRFEIATKNEIELFYQNRNRGLFISILRRIKRPVILKEDYNVDDFFLNSRKYTLIEGHWQNEQYFSHLRNEIIHLFRFNPLPAELNRVEEEMENTNSVAIHVRRGDYIKKANIFAYHGTLGLDYYLNAHKLIQDKKGKLNCYIFSDDPDWVKQNMAEFFESPVFSASKAIDEMHLMSRCKHIIIANSSFSWWAAWLNNNPGRIVCAPKKWFANEGGNVISKHIVPKEWIRV